VSPDDDLVEGESVAFEFGDVLDLHSFPPGQVTDLVRDWLDAAATTGRTELRLIHGRGVGVQRKRAHALLARDPRVLEFRDAPAEAGGWGATLVTLRGSDPEGGGTAR
jgi:DNA-nicking Smr family endonuclease